MSMQSEGKDAKGRNYNQVTRDGTSSAGTMGTGSTGDVGRTTGSGTNAGSDSGNMQKQTRTDDLLTDGGDDELRGGYVGEEAGELQTGMGGIGSLSTGNAGSRQSEGEIESDETRSPQPGGQRTRK